MQLLKRRLPTIETPSPAQASPGFEHLDRGALMLLRWLTVNRVEFVLIGEVARAMHSRSATKGPVAIVPAPHQRNLERLAGALNAVQARVREYSGEVPGAPLAGTRITAGGLSGQDVWKLACGSQPIDVVGTAAPAANGRSGASGYQELLYEATRFEPSPGLTIEAASPEDIEHYAHLRRTGAAPEMKITRRSTAGQGSTTSESSNGHHSSRPSDTDPAPTEAPGLDSPRGSG